MIAPNTTATATVVFGPGYRFVAPVIQRKKRVAQHRFLSGSQRPFREQDDAYDLTLKDSLGRAGHSLLAITSTCTYG